MRIDIDNTHLRAVKGERGSVMPRQITSHSSRHQQQQNTQSSVIVQVLHECTPLRQVPHQSLWESKIPPRALSWRTRICSRTPCTFPSNEQLPVKANEGKSVSVGCQCKDAAPARELRVLTYVLTQPRAPYLVAGCAHNRPVAQDCDARHVQKQLFNILDINLQA